jgi:hypothetical protein
MPHQLGEWAAGCFSAPLSLRASDLGLISPFLFGFCLYFICLCRMLGEHRGPWTREHRIRTLDDKAYVCCYFIHTTTPLPAGFSASASIYQQHSE